MTVVAFADPLGPRGRRRVRIATAAGAVVVAAVVVVAVRRFQARGQLEGVLWERLFSGEAATFLWGGLLNTAKAAAAGGAIALVLGMVLALARLTPARPLRVLAAAWVAFFRSVPLILLILFCYFGLPKLGYDLGRFWSLVTALVLYNSSVLAEIVRAGVLSLDRGQREAGIAVGLTEGQAMRLVVLPQALRRMVPALVSQLVVLLKDTSLGVAIAYEELLRRGQLAGQFLRNPLQSLIVVAAIYFVVNATLSQLARWLERRQATGRAKKAGPGGPVAVSGVEDLTATT